MMPLEEIRDASEEAFRKIGNDPDRLAELDADDLVSVALYLKTRAPTHGTHACQLLQRRRGQGERRIGPRSEFLAGQTCEAGSRRPCRNENASQPVAESTCGIGL